MSFDLAVDAIVHRMQLRGLRSRRSQHRGETLASADAALRARERIENGPPTRWRLQVAMHITALRQQHHRPAHRLPGRPTIGKEPARQRHIRHEILQRCTSQRRGHQMMIRHAADLRQIQRRHIAGLQGHVLWTRLECLHAFQQRKPRPRSQHSNVPASLTQRMQGCDVIETTIRLAFVWKEVRDEEQTLHGVGRMRR